MRNFQEEARLNALQQLKLLDTPASESFDRITRMASQIFGLPVAAVSLTDHDRQWFKSRVGIDHWSIPRHKAPCAEVAETAEPLVIDDFLADPFYADSLLAQNGTRFYAGAPLVTSDGYGLGSLCVLGTEPRQASPGELRALTDLAAMVMSQIELQHAFGRVDPVSALPSRTQFREDLIDLARDLPGEQRFAIVVDLARDDQVSKMARVLGGGRVDEMVREAAMTLREALDPGRTVYHVGATQFAFLSPPGLDQATYLNVLRSRFEQLRTTSSVRFVTSVAVGVRPFTLGDISADDILRGAVSAAQDARTADGAISLYSAANDRTHRRQYDLLHDLGAALGARDQLRLVYQPRIDLATTRCVGAEALLRWRHPTLGEISPAEFIPLVEQTSLARAVTQWVLDAGMDQLAYWAAQGISLTLSINVSAANLAELDLIQRIQLGLLKRHLRPDQLEIELTESAIMDQPEQALGMLRELASTGTCVAIDDFGTGQSSLAYLQRLPAQIVKIDQAFVRDLVQDHGSDFVLVETMIGLAHKLGFRVVAEGVETPEAAAILAEAGCEEAQGFLFARPMEAMQLEHWLANDRAHGEPKAHTA
ncbi:sensor domain-containing phosphodiesterase [Sphingomonas sp. 8AM]|uniref:sensor domain-containing phosphodiesterase n=1 Tax=Sphingomonas sp. 8AM TaxID=2653170 RepID=UPI0012F44C5A|nr:sensor domain-containing phosphodiesterase [Sphingomonas sp. 8AM]VXC80808.1 Cyclic di-GMP phosphodiesterase Gmr [Sphingomonas sp. 8AM]